MNRLWSIPLLLVLIGAGCALPWGLTADYCADTRPAIAVCAEQARSEDWDRAALTAHGLLERFDRFRRGAGCFLSDTSLAEVEDTLQEIRIYVRLRDAAELEAACFRAEKTLTALARGPSLSWERFW